MTLPRGILNIINQYISLERPYRRELLYITRNLVTPWNIKDSRVVYVSTGIWTNAHKIYLHGSNWSHKEKKRIPKTEWR